MRIIGQTWPLAEVGGRFILSFRPTAEFRLVQFELKILQNCRFLAGPTGCGKTAISLVLAQRLDAEIVALDSMSLYRGMDVGTAKPPVEARRKVPHHLIDVIEPHEEFNVAQYVQAAQAVCRDIISRGRIPLFVGGTGLYLRAILRGVFEGPEADWDFRRQLRAEAAQREPGYLHRRLGDVDPMAAGKLHPNDTRRLVRALEVYHVTRRPLSEQQAEQPLSPQHRPRHVDWLSPPRKWLYEQIDRRTEAMVGTGLVDEVRRLLAAQQPMSRTARQALGYKEMIDHLQGGLSLDEVISSIQRRTRQFAKRQHTWFRNLEECTAIEMTGEETAEELADRILYREMLPQI